MANVSVITGGAGGMGFATAKNTPKEKVVLLADLNEARLQESVEQLRSLGYEAHYCVYDASDRDSVKALVEFAGSLGEIKNVINTAGVSPTMANPETILRINALGTIYVNEEFSAVMKPKSVIVDIASNSAYYLPEQAVREDVYALADTNPEAFIGAILQMTEAVPDDYQKSGMAYSISKNFTRWYAQKCAFEYGSRGIRVVSLSPGLIATAMGKAEASEGSFMLKFTAEERMGEPDELGFAIATLADERNGYLAGVDVLCDGGAFNGQKFRNAE